MKYWVNYVYFYKDDLSTYFCFLHWSCPLSFVIIQFYCYYWIFCYHFYIHIVWSFLSIDAFNCCSIHEICCLTFDLDTVCFVVYLSVVWAVWMFGVSTQLLQPDVQTWKSGSGCWPHTVIHAGAPDQRLCNTGATSDLYTDCKRLDWNETNSPLFLILATQTKCAEIWCEKVWICPIWGQSEPLCGQIWLVWHKNVYSKMFALFVLVRLTR